MVLGSLAADFPPPNKRRQVGFVSVWTWIYRVCLIFFIRVQGLICWQSSLLANAKIQESFLSVKVPEPVQDCIHQENVNICRVSQDLASKASMFMYCRHNRSNCRNVPWSFAPVWIPEDQFSVRLLDGLWTR